MDVREKLVELLGNIYLPMTAGPDVIGEYRIPHKCKKEIADHLIANGVTVQDKTEISDKLLEQLRNTPVMAMTEEPTVEFVQEWISVKEHLPQENEPEGALCEQVQVLLDNGVVSTGWCNRSTKQWWHLNDGETRFVGYDYEHTPVIAWQLLAKPPKGE